MSHQIVLQPDGKFCILSSGSDSIIAWDGTEEEILKFFIEEKEKELKKTVDTVRKNIELVKTGKSEQVYYQFAETFESAYRINKDKESREALKHLIP